MNSNDKMDNLIDAVHDLDKKVVEILTNQKHQQLQLIALNDNYKDADKRLKAIEDARLVYQGQMSLIVKVIDHPLFRFSFVGLIIIAAAFHKEIMQLINT